MTVYNIHEERTIGLIFIQLILINNLSYLPC
nr:MAG TPA: hypothetical protein [Caudoviricetes sp.]